HAASSSPISPAIASSQSASRVRCRGRFFFFLDHSPNFGLSSGRACSISVCSLMSRFTDAKSSRLSSLIFHLLKSFLCFLLPSKVSSLHEVRRCDTSSRHSGEHHRWVGWLGQYGR